tara:strand:+ start:1165 stop:1380 length:216 start_codon:yes stop_codon:yes gene_type:complete
MSKDLHIRGITPECHQKLKIYSAIVDKPQAEALDEALTVAINARRKSLYDVFEATPYDLSDEVVLAKEGEL